MPSVSLSNYEPLTRFGLHYEIFEARMSHSDNIVWQDGYTSGNPAARRRADRRSNRPAAGPSASTGWCSSAAAHAAVARSAALNALFNPSGTQNRQPGLDQNATNQEASFTSSFLFTGPVPFAVYAEYAGEDTSRGRNYLLGNSALSWGIHFPRLGERFDLTLEASEWQNGWYVHTI